MYKNLARTILLILVPVSLINVSCEYTPTGANFTEVDNAIPKDITIDLENFDEPIYLKGTGSIILKYNFKGRAVTSMSICLDGNRIGSRESNFDRIKIDTEKYFDGEHTLKLSFYTTSKTGSYADAHYAERFLFEKEFTIIIDNSKLETIEINEVRIEDGRLKILWMKNNNYFFRKYLVYKRLDKSGNEYELQTTITDREITSWTDSTYIGGPIIYRVNVVAENSVRLGIDKKINYSYPKFCAVDQNYKNRVKICWNKSLFYNNFERYYLSRALFYSSEEFIFESVSDTEFVEDISVFQKKIQYRMSTNSRGSTMKHDTTTWLGTRMQGFTSMKFSSATNSIYFRRTDQIYRSDLNTLEVLNSHQISYSNYPAHCSFDVSENGLYAYCSIFSKIYKLDPLDFRVLEIYDTKEFLGHSDCVPFYLKVSNNNRIGFSGRLITYDGQVTHSRGLDGINVIDMENKKQIARTDIVLNNMDPLQIKFSDNGKYIVSTASLMKVDEGELRNHYDTTIFKCSFIDDGEMCLISENGTLTIRNTETMDVIKDLSNGTEYFDPLIDPLSNLIACYDNQIRAYIIINRENGQIIRKIFADISYEFEDYHLINKILFSESGYYLRIVE